MKRLVIAVLVLAGVTADVQAGPICNIIDRIQTRRAERQAARSGCQACSPAPIRTVAAVPICPTCPVQTSPAAVPGNCPGGRCPLPRPVVEVPSAPAAEPTVVVFASPRRMP